MTKQFKDMKVGVLFSGGKDSTYALYKAMQNEEVACLITVFSKNPESYMFHTPNIHLTELQAKAIGLPLLIIESEGKKEEELKDLKMIIATAKEKYKIEGIVTGAVLSVYQSSRVQKICDELNLKCINPLWKTEQEKYLRELVNLGFKVMIVGVFAEPFDKNWLGREIDETTISELKKLAEKYKITLTGEGGEFESFVTDGPIFKKKIVIVKASKEYSNFSGIYRIEKAKLAEK
jgi:ABC transporter with metal-binding/Fe-S-binding domain ATP-binding protein